MILPSDGDRGEQLRDAKLFALFIVFVLGVIAFCVAR